MRKIDLGNPELSDIVAQMAHNGGLDSVELYGGELTLRSDFFSILDAARNHGLKRIKIVTNARALADINAAVKTVESGCSFFEMKVHQYQIRYPRLCNSSKWEFATNGGRYSKPAEDKHPLSNTSSQAVVIGCT